MGEIKGKKTVQISRLMPYENNPKTHGDRQIDQIAESIKEFGFISPVLIDEKNRVIAGHGRIEAAKRLGMTAVPCVSVAGLTDEQRRAYIIADNRLTELGGWDKNLLANEMQLLQGDGFNVDLTGFNIESVMNALEESTAGWYGDERQRTNDSYNLDIAHETMMTDDFWQMPVIRRTDYIPEDLIGFNYAKSSKRKNVGIHFYVDDYQFERVWNKPEKYSDILVQYDCILTPDFSLYMDMPMPMKIWNVYRSRQIGAYYQDQGITVIPTLSWAEADTFEFCFRGIEPGGVVSVSTVGVKRDSEAMEIWTAGMDEAIRQLEPSCVLLYGGDIGYPWNGIEIRSYTNAVTENWKK